jgi:hypothetical protein
MQMLWLLHWAAREVRWCVRFSELQQSSMMLWGTCYGIVAGERCVQKPNGRGACSTGSTFHAFKKAVLQMVVAQAGIVGADAVAAALGSA